MVYPSGTGIGPFCTWNAGGFRGKIADGNPDDVACIGKSVKDISANDLMWEFFQNRPMK